MKFLPVAVAFVSFCVITFHSNPAFAAVIDTGAPPEDAVVVPLELKEPDDATAAAASVIDATPEEAASVPRRRRKLVTKKTGPLDAQVAQIGTTGGCPSGTVRIPDYDYKCSYGIIFCRNDCCSGPDCRFPLDRCYLRGPEKNCKAYGCYWYPHGSDVNVGVGRCSSSAGVSCGEHRAPYCDQCPLYDNKDKGKEYCNGDCKWYSQKKDDDWYEPMWGYCEPK